MSSPPDNPNDFPADHGDLDSIAAIIDILKRDVDRTLLQSRLPMSVDERLVAAPAPHTQTASVFGTTCRMVSLDTLIRLKRGRPARRPDRDRRARAAPRRGVGT